MTKQAIAVYDNEIVALGPVIASKAPDDVKHYLQLRAVQGIHEVGLTDDQARQIAHHLLSRIGEPIPSDDLFLLGA